MYLAFDPAFTLRKFILKEYLQNFQRIESFIIITNIIKPHKCPLIITIHPYVEHYIIYKTDEDIINTEL